MTVKEVSLTVGELKYLRALWDEAISKCPHPLNRNGVGPERSSKFYGAKAVKPGDPLAYGDDWGFGQFKACLLWLDGFQEKKTFKGKTQHSYCLKHRVEQEPSLKHLTLGYVPNVTFIIASIAKSVTINFNEASPNVRYKFSAHWLETKGVEPSGMWIGRGNERTFWC